METTAKTVNETLLASASEMAEKLNMRKEETLDWRTTWDRQLTMLVTPDEIIFSRVRLEQGEMRTYKYEKFYLKDELLLEKRYGITETGWECMPTVTYPLPEGVVIYTGW